jgi:hypothetical protein
MRFLPQKSKQVDCAPLMNRLRAVALAVGMMLVAPLGASAQACMCADTGLELPLSAVDAELLQDAIDASERDALASHDDLGTVKQLDMAKLVLAAPTDGEDLPWCTSQNDARCSKRPAGSVPSLIGFEAAPSLVLSSLIALPSTFSVDCGYAEYSCGGPRDAMRSPFERPPQ